MKKMMLLAAMVALAALMLAAAPAFADEPAVCDKDNPGSENNPQCDEDNDDEEDDGFDFTDRDRFIFRDVGNFDFSPSFEASQETEQDCDTGEVSQSIDVTGGDNSIQTVGLQPTAVTGCAQNAVGVLDADPIFAAQGGDLAFNFDENNVIVDIDCDGEDDDGDGSKDEDNEDCDVNGDDHNGDDNGDDNGDNVVEINDDDDFRFGGDRLIIHGSGDGGDTEVEDNTAEINASPTQSIEGGGNLTQTAIAIGELKDGVPWWLTS